MSTMALILIWVAAGFVVALAVARFMSAGYGERDDE